MRRFKISIAIAIIVAVSNACLFACAVPQGEGTVKPPLVCVHNFGEWTSDGENTHTRACSACGATEAVAHRMEDWYEYGEGHKRGCFDCGEQQVGEHDYELRHVNVPTCEADGDDAYVCKFCKRTHWVTITASGHAWSYSSVDDDTHTRKCGTCKTEQTLAHEFCDWTDNGQTEHARECERCGHTATVAHEFGEWTSDGAKTHSQKCDACGNVQTLGHDRGNCTYYSAAMHEYTCTVCGERELEPHSYGNVGDYACTWCGWSTATLKLAYELASDGNSYVVSGIGEATDTYIRIPSEYNGKPISAIKERAFYGNDTMTEVFVPNNIVSIGASAFDGCANLTSVTIYGMLTEIADNTFARCEKLTTVNIPSSVKTIGEYAFYHCLSLQNIRIPSGVTSMGSYAFQDCHSLKSVVLPDGITNIGEFTFENCMALNSVVMPKNTVYIGDSAFGGCAKLQTIEIPESVEYIGRYVFYQCTALATIDYKGTKAQWAAINKETNEAWDAYTGDYTVKCSDGDIPKR